jgi:hypothetical protein
MPVITRFYGIVIRMYFREHGVPHFHAVYGDAVGVFEIASLSMIEGDLPLRAKRMVMAWARKYQTELTEMWKNQEYVKLPGLE